MHFWHGSSPGGAAETRLSSQSAAGGRGSELGLDRREFWTPAGTWMFSRIPKASKCCFLSLPPLLEKHS